MLGICCECLKKIADTANRCPHCGAKSPFREPPMSIWKKIHRWSGKWHKRFGKLTTRDLALILLLILFVTPLSRIVDTYKDYRSFLLPLVPVVIFCFWWKRRLKMIDEKVKYEEAKNRGRQRRRKNDQRLNG